MSFQLALGVFVMLVALSGDRSEPGSIACFISSGFCFGLAVSSALEKKFR